MKERNLYLDVVKGLTIVMVVVGHCIQFGSGANVLHTHAFFADPLFKFIYSFHMPMFMLVSGYLFRYSIQRPTAQIAIAKVRSIVVPLVVWVTLYQGGLLLLLAVWWLMRRFPQPSVSRLLQKLGQAALCIYIVNHYLNSFVLPLLPAHGINYLVTALESVGVLATAYAAYVLLKHYSLTRLLFLGGR